VDLAGPDLEFARRAGLDWSGPGLSLPLIVCGTVDPGPRTVARNRWTRDREAGRTRSAPVAKAVRIVKGVISRLGM
jgi:hypothetical protein